MYIIYIEEDEEKEMDFKTYLKSCLACFKDFKLMPIDDEKRQLEFYLTAETLYGPIPEADIKWQASDNNFDRGLSVSWVTKYRSEDDIIDEAEEQYEHEIVSMWQTVLEDDVNQCSSRGGSDIESLLKYWRWFNESNQTIDRLKDAIDQNLRYNKMEEEIRAARKAIKIR